MGIMALQTVACGVGVAATGAFDVAGQAHVLHLECEFACPGRGACHAGGDMAHDAALDSSHLSADRAMHMLHCCQVLMATAV